MSVATLRKAEKRGERGLRVVHGAATRGAGYAKAQVDGLATQGKRLARSVDGQIKEVTGRHSAAWIDDALQLAGDHRWTTFALAALAVYALFALLLV